MGPLLFIIYINDILNDLECEGLLFADDTSLTTSGADANITTERINRDLDRILEWSKIWKVTFNASKTKDMIFSNKLMNNSPPILFNNSVVDRVVSHKHLGVYLTSTLDWSLQVHETCMRAYRKLAVLRSVKLLQRNTLDLLYKLTIRSIIDYGLIVYGTSLKVSDLKRYEQIQYRAGKLITGAFHLTSADKINTELGWESIKTRIDFLGLSLFHKINYHETRPLIRSYLNNRIFNLNSRQYGRFESYPNYGSKFDKSFFPYFTKKWETLNRSEQNTHIFDEFKVKLKSKLKPSRYKHFSYGSRLGNKLWTRIRLGRSSLNAHSFEIQKVGSPSCLCHFRNETPMHYFLDCFLYTIERQLLIDQVGQLVANFDKMPKYKKLEIFLYGILDNDEIELNKEIVKHVQTFILQTKRFLNRN